MIPDINVHQQELLDVALSLASEGDRLIENSHYAEDSIRPKCSELRGVCEEISSTLRHKKGLLLRALELHHALEKVGVGFCSRRVFSLPPEGLTSFSCRRQGGARRASSCWLASPWTAASPRMERRRLCKNWSDTWTQQHYTL